MRSRSLVLLVGAMLVATACGSTTPSGTIAPASPPASEAPATTAPTPTPEPTPATTEFQLMDFNIEYGGDEVEATFGTDGTRGRGAGPR
jgi:hypothetical protein